MLCPPPDEVTAHDALRLLVEDGSSHLRNVLRAELTCQRQGSPRVGDVVDDEKPLSAEERQVGNRRQQQRLFQTLVDAGVELDVQRRHVPEPEGIRERASYGQ